MQRHGETSHIDVEVRQVAHFGRNVAKISEVDNDFEECIDEALDRVSQGVVGQPNHKKKLWYGMCTHCHLKNKFVIHCVMEIS